MTERAGSNSEFSDIQPLDVSNRIQSHKRVALGGHSDIWLGSMERPDGRLLVAIKELRVRPRDSNMPHEERFRRRFYREVSLWCRLHHQNIVPLLGIATSCDGLPKLISPWYMHGDIVSYMQAHPNANRPQLIIDVARGLSYLHSLPFVHGDIKGGNILVDANGSASLCDFGTSTFLDETLHINGFTTSGQTGGTLRWMAPELLEDEPKTTMTDVWAFGCTAIQIMTNLVPYPNAFTVVAIQTAIIRGEPPLPKEYIPSTNQEELLWQEVRKCWMEPSQRPAIDILKSYIDSIYFHPVAAPISRDLSNKDENGRQQADSDFPYKSPRPAYMLLSLSGSVGSPMQIPGGARKLAYQYSLWTGKNKAFGIGINYFGSMKILNGCIYDARNKKRFFTTKFARKEDAILLITEDSDMDMPSSSIIDSSVNTVPERGLVETSYSRTAGLVSWGKNVYVNIYANGIQIVQGSYNFVLSNFSALVRLIIFLVREIKVLQRLRAGLWKMSRTRPVHIVENPSPSSASPRSFVDLHRQFDFQTSPFRALPDKDTCLQLPSNQAQDRDEHFQDWTSLEKKNDVLYFKNWLGSSTLRLTTNGARQKRLRQFERTANPNISENILEVIGIYPYLQSEEEGLTEDSANQNACRS